MWGKRIRWKYRIDAEQWHALLLEQSGRCAICAEQLKDPCVDHDHQDGRVRGLLCHPCNRGIGFLGDSYARVAAAARYLSA